MSENEAKEVNSIYAKFKGSLWYPNEIPIGTHCSVEMKSKSISGNYISSSEDGWLLLRSDSTVHLIRINEIVDLSFDYGELRWQ